MMVMAKSGWVLSEKTLSLSQSQWEDFLLRSKASEKSKSRYLLDRYKYQTIQQQREIDYKEESINFTVKRKTQQEGFYGRNVWFVSANNRITLTKKNFKIVIAELKRIFEKSLSYQMSAKYLMLKIRYRVIINRKVYPLDSYLSSTVQYVDEYKYALFDLIKKIESVVFSASIDGIVISKEITKYYSGERK